MSWSIVARNLPEHAGNAIHTDAGARAAGFERALVAGVTSYAYAVRPVIERFGPVWAAQGTAEVRFRSPVFDGDTVSFPVQERDDGGLDVVALVDRRDAPLVTLTAWPDDRGAPVLGRPGEDPIELSVVLDGEYGSQYAARAGDAADPCARTGQVHPAVWPALANHLFHRHVVRGPWIHTRSRIHHHAPAAEGAVATVRARVVDRFPRGGRRAVAEVVIEVDGAVVATLEHEAIVELDG